jgi:hypothetical protein
MEDDKESYVSEGSLSSIGAHGVEEESSDLQDIAKVKPVRESVKAWKLRELEKTTNDETDPQDMTWLRKFVKAAALLYFDLIVYMDKAKNKDENMKDDLYVKIIGAIGIPSALSTTERFTIESMLNRDLVELPLTIEEAAIDERAESRQSLDESALEDFVEEEVEENANAEEP